MKLPLHCLAAVFLLCGLVGSAFADDDTKDEKTADKESPKEQVSATPASSSSSSSSKSTTTASRPTAAHERILKDFKKVDGMIPLYVKGSRLYAEMNSSHYGPEYLILISIAKGIGWGDLLGGFSWGLGEDAVWKFRKIDDRIHVIRKNVRFKASRGTPTATALKNAYTDSVVFSLPIATKGPRGGDLVDLTPIFMSDFPQIGQYLPGFMFSSSKSTWASVKGFKDNLQLQVAATYSSSGRLALETVPDSRGATINVHYSISKLPSTGYTPRMADDRIGYFLTVQKDFSKKSDTDHFVRYINRWNLQKADSSAKLSPPKKPIVFWIEKTVPFRYRPAIRSGIEEWNKAFTKLGFANAIEVRQQPDDADWDPEDINYNTFRWITSGAGFAMGPSRVNPYTGEILDADIIFDADFLAFWKDEFETMTEASIAEMTGGQLENDSAVLTHTREFLDAHRKHRCRMSRGMARQFAFGAATVHAMAKDVKVAEELQEKFIMQGLKETTMHELGHTLGLRHNFKSSKMLSLKEMNDPKNEGKALVSSVMDYNATNLVPKGWHQGDYFTTTLGPYDYWVIEYGYKQLSGGTTGEVKELQKIASRSGEPALAFSTDEDTFTSDPDPDSNRWDLGADALEFAEVQGQLIKEVMPKLVDRLVKEGEDYSKPRRAFNVLLSQHGQAMSFVARNVGGLKTTRSHKGDAKAAAPIELIDAKVQRKSLELLEKQVFGPDAYQFDSKIYPYLASSRWSHWGTSIFAPRKDYPLHEYILMWQSRMLSQLMSSSTLDRIHDTELKTDPETDVLTTAELIQRLTKSIFSEAQTLKPGEYSNRKPAINSVRRNLQRTYLRRLSSLAMGNTFAPDDCQTIAYAELSQLRQRLNGLLKNKKLKLDSYSRAHLVESASRIGKVLDAELELSSP